MTEHSCFSWHGESKSLCQARTPACATSTHAGRHRARATAALHPTGPRAEMVSVSPEASLYEALQVMGSKRVGSVPILCAADKNVLGFVTCHSIMRHIVGNYRANPGYVPEPSVRLPSGLGILSHTPCCCLALLAGATAGLCSTWRCERWASGCMTRLCACRHRCRCVMSLPSCFTSNFRQFPSTGPTVRTPAPYVARAGRCMRSQPHVVLTHTQAKWSTYSIVERPATLSGTLHSLS